MMEYAARLSVMRRCAATHSGVPFGHFAKKWSDRDAPYGERCFTVWMDRESGTTSMSAVLCVYMCMCVCCVCVHVHVRMHVCVCVCVCAKDCACVHVFEC